MAACDSTADGLVELAASANCSVTASTSQEQSRQKPIDMMVRVDADTLLGRSDRPTVMNTTFVSAEAARRILCNAAVIPYRTDGNGNVLDIGRKTRVVPVAIERAVLARDEHRCQVPGCHHTRYLNSHHIHHWGRGGPTAADNLVSLCAAHHRAVHEQGFYVERHDGRFIFFDSIGDVVGSQ